MGSDDYIYYLNTGVGKLRKSYARSFDQESYFSMQSFLKTAKTPYGAFVKDGLTFKLQVDTDMYIGICYAKVGADHRSILITMGTNIITPKLWVDLQNSIKDTGNTLPPKIMHGPLVVDLLDTKHPRASEAVFLMQGTTKAIGWLMLNPKRVQPLVD